MASRTVRYELVEPNHRFQFQTHDGLVVVIEADGYETDDPVEIAELDAHHDDVKRVPDSKKAKD